AYESLLRSTRQGYHRRIAEVLAERFPETAATQPELLAYHYTAASFHEQAVDYWQQAGQRARQRSAHKEAIDHLTNGLENLAALLDSSERNQQELPFQLALGSSLIQVHGYGTPIVEQTFTRARELCQQLGETSQLFSMYVGLRSTYLTRGDLRTAQEMNNHLFEIAQDTPNTAYFQSLADIMQGHTSVFHGVLVQARSHFERGLHAYQSQFGREQQDPRTFAGSWLAITLWLLGYPEQAAQQINEALATAQESPYPFDLFMTLGYARHLFVLQRKHDMARECLVNRLTIASEHGFNQASPEKTIHQALEQIKNGDAKVGEALAHQGLAAYRAAGVAGGLMGALAGLASAYQLACQPEAGMKALAEALALVEKTGQRRDEAELHRLKGQLLLQQSPDNTVEAENCFRQAITIAQNQSAKSWELRAVTSLARLWQSQGKREEAYDLLTPVYGWFTEGFDTADLIDAKTLLDELSEGRS
ncbi:MAG: hypothetical protein OEU26_24280, partial [Candidatus Tectomicrobia bacterium]|nr:hypothetical protein [Candidatus Tectomicrobia bacterium]